MDTIDASDLREADGPEDRLSVTTFGLIARNLERQEFLVVKDNPDSHNAGTHNNTGTKKKFPGGGLDPWNTFSQNVAREVWEETGQKALVGDRWLFEIHRASRDGDRSAHHVLFYEGSVYEEREIVKGDEIAWAGWKTREQIEQEIADGLWYPSHAAAYQWFLKRDEFLETRDLEIIADIIFQRPLSWFEEEGTLVLCFFQQCQECDRGDSKEKSPEESDSSEKQDLVKPVSNEIKIVTSFGKETESLLLEGDVKAIVFFQDHFSDWLLLEDTAQRWVSRLPLETFPEHTSLAEVIHYFEERVQGVVTPEAVFLRSGKNTLILKSSVKEIPPLVPFCLNRAPAFYFPQEDIVDWKRVLEAVEFHNKQQMNGQKIWINREWKRMIPYTFKRFILIER